MQIPLGRQEYFVFFQQLMHWGDVNFLDKRISVVFAGKWDHSPHLTSLTSMVIDAKICFQSAEASHNYHKFWRVITPIND